MSVFESDGSASAAYLDRNLLAQLSAKLAMKLGYAVGWNFDDDDWPILYVQLPTGQISYHLPRGEVLSDGFVATPTGNMPAPDWDGHALEEKQQRIREFVESRAERRREPEMLEELVSPMASETAHALLTETFYHEKAPYAYSLPCEYCERRRPLYEIVCSQLRGKDDPIRNLLLCPPCIKALSRRMSEIAAAIRVAETEE